MPARNDVDLNVATATQTAKAVASGAVSALEACDAAIARIEKLDGPINAVVVRDFGRARAAAKAIDAGGREAAGKPLLGVPMTVKESNDVAGLPTTWGLPMFKGLPPAGEDGVAVARLKAAGAVILGKTNAPVALADWQAVNPIYGRTVNPHDHARTPGGSSGGASAALAAGMVPLELGSDIGGSIRVPAHMCGVFGHKPSWGVIPLKGHGFPGTDGIDVPLAVVGPMARSAADLAVALDVLAGPVGGPWRLDLPAARHAALKDYRVLVLDSHPLAAADASVRDPLNALARALEAAGARVSRKAADLPDLAAAHNGYVRMLTAITSRGVPGAQPIDAHAWMDLEDMQMRLARQWRAVFAGVDVVLTPPFGSPAFPHEDEPEWNARTLMIDGQATRYGAQLAWPGLATFPNLPATVAPIGRTAMGLPVGVQIIAAPFEDRTAITFARLLQEAGLAG